MINSITKQELIEIAQLNGINVLYQYETQGIISKDELNEIVDEVNNPYSFFIFFFFFYFFFFFLF